MIPGHDDDDDDDDDCHFGDDQALLYDNGDDDDDDDDDDDNDEWTTKERQENIHSRWTHQVPEVLWLRLCRIGDGIDVLVELSGTVEDEFLGALDGVQGLSGETGSLVVSSGQTDAVCDVRSPSIRVSIV